MESKRKKMFSVRASEQNLRELESLAAFARKDKTAVVWDIVHDVYSLAVRKGKIKPEDAQLQEKPCSPSC